MRPLILAATALVLGGVAEAGIWQTPGDIQQPKGPWLLPKPIEQPRQKWCEGCDDLGLTPCFEGRQFRRDRRQDGRIDPTGKGSTRHVSGPNVQ